MKLVVAALRPTPILCWRASGVASPTEDPASTLPARGIAPVRANIASRSVVLPLWNGPTSAMHRGPRGLLTSCPIAASLSWSSALDWVGGLDAPPTSAFWQAGNRRACVLFRAAPWKVTRYGRGLIASSRRDAPTAVSLDYRPGRSSRLSSPAATLRP